MSVEITIFADTPHELFALLERMGGSVSAHNLTERLETMSDALQTSIDKLRGAVERLETVEDSVQAFAEGVPGMIREAVESAAAKGATPDQLAALNDLAERIGTEASELAAAVTANTPADPAATDDATDPAEPESPADPTSPAPVEPPTV